MNVRFPRRKLWVGRRAVLTNVLTMLLGSGGHLTRRTSILHVSCAQEVFLYAGAAGVVLREHMYRRGRRKVESDRFLHSAGVIRCEVADRTSLAAVEEQGAGPSR